MKILAAVDGSPRQADALALGKLLARTDGDELVVAHVYEAPPLPTRIGAAHARRVHEQAEQVVAHANAELAGTPHRSLLIGAGSVAETLHHTAELEDADVLVVGSSHRGPFGRTVFGTVGDRLLHGAPCPVAVAPRAYAAGDPRLRRIGVAFDGAPESRAALTWGRELAAAAGATLAVLTVVEPVAVPIAPGGAPAPGFEDTLREERRTELDEAVAEQPAAVAATGRLLDGTPARSLAAAAEDLDLLVCGSRAFGPVGRVLLGSVARSLFHIAPCPVVALARTAVREPGAVTRG